MESLLTGQYKYLIWFGIAIALIYIPYMYCWVRRKKDLSAIYEHGHPEAVKVYIKRTAINDLLTIITVNGNTPIMFSKGIKYGFYLLPGKNIIHVVYQWTTISLTSMSGYETHTVDDEQLNVTVERNKEYSICYDHILEKYAFKAY